MFKSVLIIVVVIVLLIITRTIMQRVKPPGRKRPPISNDTVQCQQCQVYIPQNDALFKGDKAFCSTQHLNDWNQRS